MLPEGWESYRSDDGEQGFRRELVEGSEEIYWRYGDFRYRRTVVGREVGDGYVSVRTVTELFGRELIEPFLARKARLGRAGVRRGLREVLEWLESDIDESVDGGEVADRLRDALDEYCPASAENLAAAIAGGDCPICGEPSLKPQRYFRCEKDHHWTDGGALDSEVVLEAMRPAFEAACEHYGVDYERLKEA